MQFSKKVRPRLDRHDDLLEGAVSRALADAVERSLDLAGAGFDRRQRVRDRQAQVVVAMHAQDRVVDVLHVRPQVGDQRGVLLWNRVADRVGDVDRRGPGLDRGPDDAGQEFRLGARAVLRRKLDVAGVGFRQRHPLARQADDFIHRLLQFEFAVDRGRGQKDVDAAAFAGGLDGGGGGFDVFGHAPREPADHRAFDLGGDRLDSFEIPVADDREPGLDHVHVHAGELAGDFHFFPQVHTGARALLPVTQRGVENDDLV